MAKRVTDDRISKLRPRAAEYELRINDDGLTVRVRPNGKKCFVLRKGHAGRDYRIALGYYPDLSLEDARIEAGEALARLKKEGDYRAAERVEQKRRSFTVADLAAAWETDALKRLRPNTLALHQGRLKNHILPALGSIAIQAVTTADVCKLAAALHDDGKEVSANRCVTLIAVLYKFARRRLGHDVASPTYGFDPYPEQARERHLSDDEIRAFWTTLNDPAKPPGPVIATALKLALYSGQRASEIVGARCGEFDLERELWRVPASRCKGKMQRRRANAVPITPRLLQLIMEAPNKPGEASADAPLFPLDARKRRKRRNKAELSPLPENAAMPRGALTKGMERLCAAAGMAHCSPHDLRRSARTVLSREHLEISYEAAERAISHATGSSVSRAYDRHDYMREKRETLRKLGDELDRIIGIAPANNVILMKARA